jgi:integrase/recombinase XerD
MLLTVRDLIGAEGRVETPACFERVHREWMERMSGRGLAAGTLRGKEGSSRRFLAWLAATGVAEVSALRTGDVFAYLAGHARLAASTRSELLFFLREYLGFLVACCGVDPALAGLFPVILVNKDEVLPSVFTPAEVRRMLAALDQAGGCARRDRAVVLLAVQLGLRAGDIKGLRFEHIDWRLARLSLVQAKTGVRVDLPLPDECLFALLDYWRNERPCSDDPHVFLKSRPPGGPLGRSDTFHQLVSGCFARAGVDVAGRHHGLHSLRHSVAVSMLSGGTPYPVVGGVLGHASADTTRRYLRVDVERLRPLCLEVPDAR